MKKELLLVKGLIILLLYNTNYVFAQIPDSCTFVEGTSSVPDRPVKESVMAIEMESTNVNGGFWVVQNDIPGYIGAGFIQYVGGHYTGIPGKSQLSYTFRIVKEGIHSFKMRAYREDYEDNDVWVRFPHGQVFTRVGTDTNRTGTKGSDWFKAMIGQEDKWYSFVKAQNPDHTLHDIYVDFPEPGVYTVEFSGRSTGFRIDRFYLYQESSYFGMGTEEDPTPEALKEDCQPYATTDDPYVANAIPDQTAEGGNTWSFTLPANTFGGTDLNFIARLAKYEQLPAWMQFNSVSQTFTGNPTYENGGNYTILVQAKDNNNKYAVDAFVLTVKGNNPPVMSPPLQDTIAGIGQPFAYDISSYFSDADGHTLTFTADSSHEGTSLPSWLSLSGSTFTGNPTSEDSGNDTIYVTVSDGNGGSVSESFIIRVKSVSIQSINDRTTKIKGNLYPNPADNLVNLKLEETGNGSLTLIDHMGRVIYSEENVDLSKEISVNLLEMGMKPGLYILRIRSERKGSEYNGMIVKK